MPAAQRRQPGATKAERRRQRAAAALEAARRRERRRWRLIAAGIAAGVLVIGIVITVIVINAGSSGQSNAQPSPTTAAAPNWPAPAPAQVPAAVKAAGLPLLSMEATDVHYHAHLDVIVDGQPVQVPAQIGIAGQTAISSMHTHDPTGIIHIESPTNATFTLGQFFTEWQVPLNASCVKDLCATSGKSWRFYVNGQSYNGDPTTIVLKSHQEIAAVYGNVAADTQPPAQYDFPDGL
jgi:hypothetical protein